MNEEGKIIVTVESEDIELTFDQLGVTFDSSSAEILAAVQPVVLERTGVNILEDDDTLYTVKKADNSGNVYIFPKSPAGEKTQVEALASEVLDIVDGYCNLDGAADGLYEAVEDWFSEFLKKKK
jgi:hypothetical protein